MKKTADWWDAVPCSLVEMYQCVRGACCLCNQHACMQHHGLHGITPRRLQSSGGLQPSKEVWCLAFM